MRFAISRQGLTRLDPRLILSPFLSFIVGVLVLVFPFLYFPWVVSREHGISYRTALMNLYVWLFRDRTEARLLRLAHEEREDIK